MVAHISLIGGHPVFLLSQGSLGVEVFIFISGFLMALILKDEARVDADALRRFYIRRFFRIAPSFYAALLLYIACRPFFTAGLSEAQSFFATPYLISGLHDALSWRSVVSHVLFLHGLSPGEATKIFGPAWSLSLEMQFYLVAPFCVWALRRQPFLTLGALFVINLVANELFGFYGKDGAIANFTYPSFLPNRIFLFVLGGSYCVYLFARTHRNLVAFLLALVAAFPVLGFKSFLTCLMIVIVIQFAVLSAGRGRRMWTDVARSRPIHLMAEWSYGLYLFHMFCMALSGHLLGKAAATLPARFVFPCYFATVVVLSIALSALTHTLIEKPWRNYGKQLSRTRSAATR